ncbi:hypothetical protein SARC_01867 [Sphaeroforma arctica JP610]|uniref:SGNH domain-containing protein n=1 Tax=Sphaeroforma arctica JP610 TaxID=667725 RepID=A0A0L0GAA2_9EUKA|nr:hypothetical protein SARC_01867 [Sphaeroforma arctica JP610]KNC85962.1 hypothetical protein SARC_01867 [Sphaeroforma arctica JP610]|eukprot:XP_014159864.1 hypothetical protein SARC_01867 [Sphaeroforma arctica JP610]
MPVKNDKLIRVWLGNMLKFCFFILFAMAITQVAQPGSMSIPYLDQAVARVARKSGIRKSRVATSGDVFSKTATHSENRRTLLKAKPVVTETHNKTMEQSHEELVPRVAQMAQMVESKDTSTNEAIDLMAERQGGASENTAPRHRTLPEDKQHTDAAMDSVQADAHVDSVHAGTHVDSAHVDSKQGAVGAHDVPEGVAERQPKGVALTKPPVLDDAGKSRVVHTPLTTAHTKVVDGQQGDITAEHDSKNSYTTDDRASDDTHSLTREGDTDDGETDHDTPTNTEEVNDTRKHSSTIKDINSLSTQHPTPETHRVAEDSGESTPSEVDTPTQDEDTNNTGDRSRDNREDTAAHRDNTPNSNTHTTANGRASQKDTQDHSKVSDDLGTRKYAGSIEDGLPQLCDSELWRTSMQQGSWHERDFCSSGSDEYLFRACSKKIGDDKTMKWWIPDNCPEMKPMSPRRTCKALQRTKYRRLILIGDSLVRGLWLALTTMTHGDFIHGALSKETSSAEKTKCDVNSQFWSPQCRGILIAKTSDQLYTPMCPTAKDRTRLPTIEYWEYAKAEFGADLAQKLASALSDPSVAVFMGVGLHNNLKGYRTKSMYVEPIATEWQKQNTAATLIWLSMHAQDIDKKPMRYRKTQDNDHVRAFNRNVNTHVDNKQMLVFDTYALTESVHTPDGTHYGYGVNAMKAQYILQWLETKT